MKYFLRLVWGISAAGFLLSLFYYYGHISQIVDIEWLNGHFLLSRNEFFFLFFAIFAVANLLLTFLGQLVPTIPSASFWVPNRRFWLADLSHRRSANMIIINGLTLLAFTVNYLIIFWMMVLGSENHFEGSRNPNLHFFQWPGLFLIVCCFFPFIRLWIKNPNFLSRTDRA